MLTGRFWNWRRNWKSWVTPWNLWKSSNKRLAAYVILYLHLARRSRLMLLLLLLLCGRRTIHQVEFRREWLSNKSNVMDGTNVWQRQSVLTASSREFARLQRQSQVRQINPLSTRHATSNHAVYCAYFYLFIKTRHVLSTPIQAVFSK